MTSSTTLTSLGVGSGLDAEGIISKLMSIEKQPIVDLQTAEAGLKTDLSAYGTLQSLMSAMQDKARALSSLTLWGQTAAASSDPTVVTGSTSTGAAVGTYAVTVEQLAAAQTVTSGVFSGSDSKLNAGSLTIDLGSWDGGPPPTGFTPKAGSTSVSISIGPDETSLSAIRDKINAAGAGVTATIINDAKGSRLSLQSSTPGASNGFRITATETADDGNPATGLSALGFNALGGATPMTENQWGANAKATVNGIPVESASNTLSNISDGLSLTVSKLSDTPVQINVATDTNAITTAVKDFVTAFNAVASNIKTQTAYDSTSKTGGPLLGESTVNSLQWALRGVLNQPSSASSVFSSMSSMGITMGSDGTLSINSSKLSSAMSNQTELKKAFTADTGVGATSGFMTRFNNLASAMLDTTTGSLATRQQGIQASITANEKQQAAMTDRANATEARMRAQYQALDTQMASLNALSSYITQQFSTTTSSG